MKYAPPTRNIHIDVKDAKRMNFTSPTAFSMFGSVNANGHIVVHMTRQSEQIGIAASMDEGSSP